MFDGDCTNIPSVGNHNSTCGVNMEFGFVCKSKMSFLRVCASKCVSPLWPSICDSVLAVGWTTPSY